jgi:hypothetical protein
LAPHPAAPVSTAAAAVDLNGRAISAPGFGEAAGRVRGQRQIVQTVPLHTSQDAIELLLA